MTLCPHCTRISQSISRTYSYSSPCPSSPLPHHGTCSEPPYEVQPCSPSMPGVPYSSLSTTLLHLFAFSGGSLQVRMTADSPIEVGSDDLRAESSGQFSVFRSFGFLTCLIHAHFSGLLGCSSFLIPASQLFLLHPLLLFLPLCLPSGCWCSPGGPGPSVLLVNVVSLELLIRVHVLTLHLTVGRKG